MCTHKHLSKNLCWVTPTPQKHSKSTFTFRKTNKLKIGSRGVLLAVESTSSLGAIRNITFLREIIVNSSHVADRKGLFWRPKLHLFLPFLPEELLFALHWSAWWPQTRAKSPQNCYKPFGPSSTGKGWLSKLGARFAKAKSWTPAKNQMSEVNLAPGFFPSSLLSTGLL